MGFNTAMMVQNDHLHEIENDPEFGRKVSDAVRQTYGREKPYMHGFDMLPTAHADTMQVVAVGGNTIRRLGYSGYAAEDEAILRDVARQLGFRLVKIKASEPV